MCWVCRCWEIQDKYCVGVHSSVIELVTILAIQPFHLLGSLINPNIVLALLDFDMSLAMCDISIVPLFLVGIMPILGVAMLLRD